jgi:hypothetical protein
MFIVSLLLAVSASNVLTGPVGMTAQQLPPLTASGEATGELKEFDACNKMMRDLARSPGLQFGPASYTQSDSWGYIVRASYSVPMGPAGNSYRFVCWTDMQGHVKFAFGDLNAAP